MPPPYERLYNKYSEVRRVLGAQRLTLAEKILYSHLDNVEESLLTDTAGGRDIRGKANLKLKPDRVNMQDASAQMALLQFMSCNLPRTAIPASIHCDHLIVGERGADDDLSAGIETNKEVFDFLESRRETITARHFNSTKLVILRSCNDLLRRLSRAEDTPFCGRVFIFLFQVFPLGDKSSVNLRGEYHVENVTTYDDAPGQDGDDAERMEVDNAPEAGNQETGAKGTVKGGAPKEAPILKPDALYGVFWSLQASFSQPKRLFDSAHFTSFKFGLEATLAAFKQIKNDHGSRIANSFDEAKRGAKRKRNQQDEELADTYNPKYLTSRDLFELEVSSPATKFLLQSPDTRPDE